jgi:hypothetical protein
MRVAILASLCIALLVVSASASAAWRMFVLAIIALFSFFRALFGTPAPIVSSLENHVATLLSIHIVDIIY